MSLDNDVRIIVRTCQMCRKHGTDMKKCSICLAVRYCSKECQLANWPVHKEECKDLAIKREKKDRIVEVCKKTSSRHLVQGEYKVLNVYKEDEIIAEWEKSGIFSIDNTTTDITNRPGDVYTFNDISIMRAYIEALLILAPELCKKTKACLEAMQLFQDEIDVFFISFMKSKVIVLKSISRAKNVAQKGDEDKRLNTLSFAYL